MNALRHLLGALAGIASGLLWSPIILFLAWLPRLGYPDELAYGCAIAFILCLAILGLRRPRWGARALALASLSWIGIALLLWLNVIELA